LEFGSSSPEHLTFPLKSKLAGRVEGRSKQARPGLTAHITALGQDAQLFSQGNKDRTTGVRSREVTSIY
jgi:hypothetical protein